jgi:periplasmic protein TonB
MFEDSLIESSGRLAARHPWTTAVSFLCQSIAISALLLLSLLYTESLPSQHWINVLQAPPPPPAAAPLRPVTSSAAMRISSSTDALTVPSEIPTHVAMIHDEAPATSDTVGVVGSIPNGVPNGISVSLLDAMKPTAPPPPRPALQKLRVSSGVAQGMLIQQVKPQYPAPARTARVEGRVLLQAVIGKDGSVQNLHVISGHPLLVGAAIDAVKQWRYKPYYLNAEPVEVETQIVVNFVLTQN